MNHLLPYMNENDCNRNKSDIDSNISYSSSDESLRYKSNAILEYFNENCNTIHSSLKGHFRCKSWWICYCNKQSKNGCSKKPVDVKEKMNFLINLDKHTWR